MSKKNPDLPHLVVASRVKEIVKFHDCRTGSDAVEALNRMVEWHVNQAIQRARSNGRRTLRAFDFEQHR
jgi:histone H3/H4